ncbi:MAG: FtsW/RodA/SpoVE family cell cycle protein [Clostridiales bacterium]|jgi:cell division protein FtsW|nr:FtsW/RodA/SpoVE family cell cycle protein [Clostridiales bacterium]
MEIIKRLYGEVTTALEELDALLSYVFGQLERAGNIYTLVVRWVFPILSLFIFIRCLVPLLHKGKRGGAWGYLRMENGTTFPLVHWENSIGRGKLSDIRIELPVISRNHAVLTYSNGMWKIFDLGSGGGALVNGKKVEKSEVLGEDDEISLAGVKLTLLPASQDSACPEIPQRSGFDRVAGLGRHINTGSTLLLIMLFQLLGGLQLCFSMGDKAIAAPPAAVLVFIIVEAIYFILSDRHGGKYLELEMMAFFLCGLSLFIVGSAAPVTVFKQLVSIIIGIIGFSVFKGLMRNLNNARKLRYVLAVLAIGLLVANLIVGEYRYGAKNWIDLGFISFQPSEFVKVAFVLAGAATLDKLLTAKNMTKFIIFSGICVCSLVLMRDLGTALIFFIAFLVIAFMRSGDIKTIAIICGGAILGAAVAVFTMPYIAARFAAWGRVWEYADTSGYQQTRTMIYAASGGLLGVGAGNGYFVGIPAADTDLVFGLLCEEWGLIVGVTAVMIVLVIVIFAPLTVGRCRSSFYAVSACGAAAIFLIQSALNVFGSVDILPLTGVTLPFVSNGGSSMIASWCLLAFIKTADERRRPDLEDIIMEELDELTVTEGNDCETDA